MRKKLLYIKNGKQISGPFSQAQLDRMRQKGLLTAGDVISDNRISWKSVEDFFAPPQPEESLQPEKTPLPEKSPETESADIIKLQQNNQPLPPPSLRLFEPEDDDKKIEPEKEKNLRILPDPISAAIAMCWNAPGQLAKFYLSRRLAAEKDPDKPDRSVKYFSASIVLMLIVIFAVYLALTGFVMPEFFISLGVMPLVLFMAVALLIFVENLFLAFGMKLENMVEAPLMQMQQLFIALPAFVGGLPLYALLIAGINNCPVLLTAAVILYSALILFVSLFNEAAGFWQINYHVFKFKRNVAVALIIMFALQHLAFYLIGFLLYKMIQN